MLCFVTYELHCNEHCHRAAKCRDEKEGRLGSSVPGKFFRGDLIVAGENYGDDRNYGNVYIRKIDKGFFEFCRHNDTLRLEATLKADYAVEYVGILSVAAEIAGTDKLELLSGLGICQ